MCGISGFNFQDEKLVKKMNNVIRHRGPDGEGYYIDKNVSLGHRRLSIIDLKTGQQPMTNEDKTIWIVFNGEIYNFQDLKLNLEKAGHIFTTNSDTEVIIHAYEQYGFNCLQKFNGMFAFCIYDKKKSMLFLARDRFGKKPLYYYHLRNKFYFASEIKALLAIDDIQTTPNEEIIYAYLHNGYIPEDIAPTFFQNIYKLMPSSYITLQTGKITIKPYYSLNINKIKTSINNDLVAFNKYRELLFDSVRLRLISDVPVGSCLSGGMDSSSIVSIMKHLGKSTIHCFSAVYKEKDVDESKYINTVVKYFDVNDHLIKPDAHHLWHDIKRLVYHQDEPFESLSSYAQWCVMKTASKYVKVVLDGQGGDETLAGYMPYLRNYLLGLFKQRKILTLLKEIILNWTNLIEFLKSMYNVLFSHTDITGFFRKKTSLKKGYYLNNFSGLHQRMQYDLTHTIQKVLKYEDRNSMAFGIEARLPFLDYRLVEYVFSINENYKIRNGWTKYILRQSLKNILPEKIRLRKSKMGFPVPDLKWLQKNKKNIQKLFHSSRFMNRPYFNAEKIINIFNNLSSISNPYLPGYFWRIINTELWLQIFFNDRKKWIKS